VLRTSLSLAATLGRDLHLFNIRASCFKPGLAAQHLTCVNAAAEVCGAQVEGAEIGSTELTFRPGAVGRGKPPQSRSRSSDLRAAASAGATNNSHMRATAFSPATLLTPRNSACYT